MISVSSSIFTVESSCPFYIRFKKPISYKIKSILSSPICFCSWCFIIAIKTTKRVFHIWNNLISQTFSFKLIKNTVSLHQLCKILSGIPQKLSKCCPFPPSCQSLRPRWDAVKIFDKTCQNGGSCQKAGTTASPRHAAVTGAVLVGIWPFMSGQEQACRSYPWWWCLPPASAYNLSEMSLQELSHRICSQCQHLLSSLPKQLHRYSTSTKVTYSQKWFHTLTCELNVGKEGWKKIPPISGPETHQPLSFPNKFTSPWASQINPPIPDKETPPIFELPILKSWNSNNPPSWALCPGKLCPLWNSV